MLLWCSGLTPACYPAGSWFDSWPDAIFGTLCPMMIIVFATLERQAMTNIPRDPLTEDKLPKYCFLCLLNFSTSRVRIQSTDKPHAGLARLVARGFDQF